MSLNQDEPKRDFYPTDSDIEDFDNEIDEAIRKLDHLREHLKTTALRKKILDKIESIKENLKSIEDKAKR